ncbi:phosphatidylethanolamine-binding protein [Vararia minispora EC-137]|uniref:Phosphatidylethanolamine-binding protein n=1 Tax=Vararia minispora EC-137 TaxID=1314806 RepID=A0ACB8QC11_9AGAM|nr:phosphatidylethanolamine-binding protein [Vararia minispora EC-137]
MIFSTAVAVLSVASFVRAGTSLNIAAIEAHFNNSGIVPSLLSTFDPSATLNVTFPGVGTISPGQALTKDQVASAPQLTVTPANSSITLSGNYTVTMVDADVVGTDESKGQTRHWLVNGAQVGNGSNITTTSGTVITAYAGPGPASGSGAHRYVILLLPQPANFSPPSNLSSPNTPLGVFSLNGYISDSHLGQPVAGMYFTVEEGTATATPSATSPVNTASLSSVLARQTGSTSASASATGTPSKSGSSAISSFISGPITLFASLLGLLVL